MKVGEFKKQIDELRSSVSLLKTPMDASDLVAKLSELVAPFGDQIDIQPDMMPPVKELLKQFWNRVIRTIPCEHSNQWNTSACVKPWLALQRSLVNADLLHADFHHPMMFEELKSRFYHLSATSNSLKCMELISLLKSTSRMLLYAELDELKNYPVAKLNEKIIANRPQEIEKLQDIIFLLRSTFYLMYQHCTLEQLALMPALIYFRIPTTDEERRSELAIFNWLTKDINACVQFFNINDRYINLRSIKEVDALHHVAHLLPTGLIGRKNFLRATDASCWIYPFIHRFRGNPDFLEDKEAALEETLRLLKKDFNRQNDKSLIGVWDFALSVKMYERILTGSEAKIVHSAIYALCMEKYIGQFNVGAQPQESFSLRAEWESVKRQAAEKSKMAAVYGKTERLGFFETLAVNQGRLKKLINFLEENQTANLESYRSYRLAMSSGG